VFGIDKAWEEIHHGADLNVPRVYKFIIKYITPLFLLIILTWWIIQEWLPMILMSNVTEVNRVYILGTRIALLVLFAVIALLVKFVWRKRKALEGKAR
jgi:hypothetical protein